MILLWCLCGTTVAYCVGRYNQSNKLFWTLFTSFVLGIAGAAVYNKYSQPTKEEVKTTQVCPTQDYSVSYLENVTIDADIAMCNNMPAPVSKDTTPEESPSVIESIGDNSPIDPPPRA